MIYSQASKYAIQALVYLASIPENQYQTIQKIAKARGIPEPFLAKIFQELAKKGLLESQKGRGGGFRLAKPPEEVALLEVVESVDGLDAFKACLFGFEECDSNNPCPLHHSWVQVRDQILNFLKKHSLAGLVEDGR